MKTDIEKQMGKKIRLDDCGIVFTAFGNISKLNAVCIIDFNLI